jgi:hypothetical protein
MNAEQALITGALVLSTVVGVAATVELTTETVGNVLHAADAGEHVAQDLGIGSGAGIGGGVTITVALRRGRKGGGSK